MEFTLQDLFLKGGGFMWPLLILLIFLMVSSQFIKPDLRVEFPTGPIESAPAILRKERQATEARERELKRQRKIAPYQYTLPIPLVLR